MSKNDIVDAELEDAAAKLRGILKDKTDVKPDKKKSEKVTQALDDASPSKVYDTVTNLSPHDAHLLLAEFDLEYFGRYYLPDHFPMASCDMHKDMHNLMVKMEHRELDKPIVYVAPRDHAKSTNFSLLFPIHGVCFKQFRFIAMFADAAEQAKSHLTNISEELEDNEKLINDFGPFRGRGAWSTQKIQTKDDRVIVARGMSTRVRGMKHRNQRPDLIILDDIENERMVQSETQVSRREHTVKQSVFNLGDRGKTAIVIVGNFLPPDSVLARMYDYGRDTGSYIVRHKAAWRDNGWTKPLWPSRWTPELLAKKKSAVGHRSFLIEYMNVRNVSSSAEFPENKFIYYIKDELNRDGMRYFMGVDVQSSRSQRSDFFVISVVGLAQDGSIYDIGMYRGKPNMMKKFDLIIEWFARFNPELTVIDAQGPQKHFFDSFCLHLQREKIPMPIHPLTGASSTADSIINALSAPFHDGVLMFNRSHKQLIDELVYLDTGMSDDCAAAFSMAVKATIHYKAQRHAKQRGAKATIVKKKGRRKRPLRAGRDGRSSRLR